jgi:putative transposase
VRRENKKQRRTIRLSGYDYSRPGEYFITICTQHRFCLFGEVVNGSMILNRNGQIAKSEWIKTAEIRENVELDAFIIMPNHVHGIIRIINNIPNHVGAYGNTPPQDGNTPPQDGNTPPQDGNTPRINDQKSQNKNESNKFRSPSKTIGAIIRGYKSAVTTKINSEDRLPGRKIWQRNYYEHIIRNDQALNRIREYIIQNPMNWADDRINPKHK